MKNNAWTYLLIVAVVIVGLAMMSGNFFSSEERSVYPGTNRESIAKPMQSGNHPGDDPTHRGSLDHLLFVTFGAAVLLGCLAGFYIRRRAQDSQDQMSSTADNLSTISADMGINEYDLFQKAAGNWSVSEKRAEEDFNTYLATQRLPYYVTDYARKSRLPSAQPAEEKKVDPSSWSDWIKALIVFPGVFVFIYVALILL